MAGNGSRQKTYTGGPRRGPRGPGAARAKRSHDTARGCRADPLPRPEGVPPPGSNIGSIPLHLILEWAKQRNEESKGPRATNARYYHARAHLTALLEHLTPTTTKELRLDTRKCFDEYVGRRITNELRNGVKGSAGTVAKVKASTAKNEWQAMGKALRDFAAEFGLVGVPKISIARGGVAPVLWLERAMVARILWALRGRRWDHTTGAWQIEEDATQRRPSWDHDALEWRVDPNAKQRLLVKVDGLDFLARLVLLLVYTGSTTLCACDLAWEGDPSGSQSFVVLFEEDVPKSAKNSEQGPVDIVEEEAAQGDANAELSSLLLVEQHVADVDAWKKKRFAGHLYRLGKHAAPGSKNGVGVRISRRLAAHLFRWRAADAREGHTGAVIRRRYRRGARFGPLRPIRVPNSRLLNDLWDWAGLPPEINLDTLSETCAIWVLRAGTELRAGMKEFERNAAIMRSTAFLTARGYRHFERRFGPYDEAFMKAHKQALDFPVETVQGSVDDIQGLDPRAAETAIRRRTSSDS